MSARGLGTGEFSMFGVMASRSSTAHEREFEPPESRTRSAKAEKASSAWRRPKKLTGLLCSAAAFRVCFHAVLLCFINTDAGGI